MAYEFKLVRRVEFFETDMVGLVHYSNFFRYMEAAEHAFFRSLGISIVTRQVDPPVGWPRVHADCDFLQPVHFEDEIEIRLLVSEKKPEIVYFPAVRKFCAVCGKVSYSLSGEHPQCALKRADLAGKAKQKKRGDKRPAALVSK